MKMSVKARNAFYLGTLCTVAYFAVYLARNILSAVTPAMVSEGYTEAHIGSISSLFFTFYAVGQLINGIVGNKINAKWMMSIGLLGAGVANLVFSRITPYPEAASLAYAFVGFFLSMVYGPMTKVVSENVEPLYATRCSLGYTFSSFLGSPAAGLLASLLAWQTVFDVGSGALIVMAVICFLCFSLFERSGLVKHNKYKGEKSERSSVRVLFKHQIVTYSLVAILTGIVRTSVVFWLPTYIAQHLGFTPQVSAVIFTVSSVAISLSAFITVFVHERMGCKMNRTVLVMFSASALFFLLTYLTGTPVLNIIWIVLAIIAANGSSTVLWSMYCPSLYETGLVSGATGFLDFLSYMAAALANVIFANAASTIGWGNLILVWCGLMVIGVLISLPYRKIIKPSRVGK
ncbi:MAG: MFS transporter [Clostridia bacterium]|nr:MFS transporter [Clostridia bacterium]